MGFLNNIKKSLEKDEDFQNARKVRKINQVLDDREKSSNERALEAIIKQRREEVIKKKLAAINKQEDSSFFFHKFDPGKSHFTGKSSILERGAPILKSNKSMLHGGNMFFR